MKAPYFDVTRIPLHPSDGSFMASVVNEERRVCGGIDDRVRSLVDDFVSLAREVKELYARLENTRGFFARWTLRRRIRAITRRLSDNMSVRNELATARWRRTYGS
jgi:hypothetical protein